MPACGLESRFNGRGTKHGLRFGRPDPGRKRRSGRRRRKHAADANQTSRPPPVHRSPLRTPSPVCVAVSARVRRVSNGSTSPPQAPHQARTVAASPSFVYRACQAEPLQPQQTSLEPSNISNICGLLPRLYALEGGGDVEPLTKGGLDMSERQWIGIDLSAKAAELVKYHMSEQPGLGLRWLFIGRTSRTGPTSETFRPIRVGSWCCTASMTATVRVVVRTSPRSSTWKSITSFRRRMAGLTTRAICGCCVGIATGVRRRVNGEIDGKAVDG